MNSWGLSVSSQKHILLEALKKGEILTAYSAFKKYGISTFSQRLGEIESMGYNIAKCWETSPDNKRYMRYWLIKEA